MFTVRCHIIEFSHIYVATLYVSTYCVANTIVIINYTYISFYSILKNCYCHCHRKPKLKLKLKLILKLLAQRFSEFSRGHIGGGIIGHCSVSCRVSARLDRDFRTQTQTQPTASRSNLLSSITFPSLVRLTLRT